MFNHIYFQFKIDEKEQTTIPPSITTKFIPVKPKRTGNQQPTKTELKMTTTELQRTTANQKLTTTALHTTIETSTPSTSRTKMTTAIPVKEVILNSKQEVKTCHQKY